MTAQYLLSKAVLHLAVRLPKNEAGYFLHLLEARDNLCFATTLESEPGVGWRDILIRAPIEWEQEIRHFLQVIQTEIPVTIIDDRIVKDN